MKQNTNKFICHSTMKLRKEVWPKTISDGLSMMFMLIIVPLIYWFELFIVLPNLYDIGTRWYIFHFIFGNFLMINIVGNFTYTLMCDTSTRYIIMSVSDARIENGWRFCATCEAISPPRSWHCKTCNTCILKRDHHCIFTGCCIGHMNHRYFLMFILYLYIGTSYSFFYNNYYIWDKIEFEFPLTIIKIIFPLAIFLFNFDNSWEQFYLMLYIISVVGMCFTGVLCFYHFHLMITGSISYERNHGDNRYNISWRNNIENVLGKRWYITWMLPYINSDLPNDGLSWNTNESWKDNSKNR